MAKNNKEIFTASVFTDAGENTNQDAYFVREYKKVFAAVISDGVRGLHKGEIASRYTVKSVENWFNNLIPALPTMGMDEMQIEMSKLATRIHGEILDIAAQKSKEKGKKIMMGATMTLAMVGEKEYAILHVGDSRAYLLDKDSRSLSKLTIDQTVAQYEKDTGKIIDGVPPEKKEHTIMQCIGTKEISPAHYQGRLPKNFDLLLCTDGIYNTLSEDDIAATLLNKASGKSALKELTIKARLNGESDNISSILIRRRIG